MAFATAVEMHDIADIRSECIRGPGCENARCRWVISCLSSHTQQTEFRWSFRVSSRFIGGLDSQMMESSPAFEDTMKRLVGTLTLFFADAFALKDCAAFLLLLLETTHAFFTQHLLSGSLLLRDLGGARRREPRRFLKHNGVHGIA